MEDSEQVKVKASSIDELTTLGPTFRVVGLDLTRPTPRALSSSFPRLLSYNVSSTPLILDACPPAILGCATFSTIRFVRTTLSSPQIPTHPLHHV